jgi:serine/threonine protein phosphatase PrpC
MLTSTVATLHDNSAHGEDNYLVRTLGDDAVLDAVMDGVTRRRGGQASQLAVEALAAAPLQSADDVVAVLEDVNRRLYQMGWGQFWLTTVAAALCLDGTLYVVGVGDSSVFLIRPDACQQLSSRVRGAFIGASRQLVHLYRAEMALEPGDRLVLATDGVTDNVTSHELVEIVRGTTSPDAAAAQLRTLMTARQAGSRLPESLVGGFRHDDWTAIVRFFSAAGERTGSHTPAPP